jgi:hypothetical protein
MTTYLCGNSHIVALAKAEGTASDLTIFPLGNGRHERWKTFSRREGDGVAFLPDQYSENVEHYTGSPVITPGATWGFLNVNHNVRIYTNEMWLQFRPAALPAVDGFTPVSADLLTAIVERDQWGVRRFFTQLQDAGVDFFAVSAPFPRLDGAAVRRGIPRKVIRHIDKVARRMWSGWLGERGIALVEPPPETANPGGFLQRPYGAGRASGEPRDPHHANAAYGALMLERVRDHLKER